MTYPALLLCDAYEEKLYVVIEFGLKNLRMILKSIGGCMDCCGSESHLSYELIFELFGWI